MSVVRGVPIAGHRVFFCAVEYRFKVRFRAFSLVDVARYDSVRGIWRSVPFIWRESTRLLRWFVAEREYFRSCELIPIGFGFAYRRYFTPNRKSHLVHIWVLSTCVSVGFTYAISFYSHLGVEL